MLKYLGKDSACGYMTRPTRRVEASPAPADATLGAPRGFIIPVFNVAMFALSIAAIYAVERRTRH